MRFTLVEPIARWRKGCTPLITAVAFAALPALQAFAAPESPESPERPRRVLVLDPFGPGVAPFDVTLSEFRGTLARELGERLEIYDVSLDSARFPQPEADQSLVEFLRNRVAARPVDLVVTLGGPGMDFVVKHHERFIPNVPVVFIAGASDWVDTGALRSKAAQVTTTLALARPAEITLQLLPRTTNLVVVAGTSPLEARTVDECRRAFRGLTNRVTFTWLTGLPLDEVVERTRRLPPRTAILYTLLLVDAVGIPYERNEPLRRLRASANAPIFGYFASELGLGPVGGRLYPDLELGAEAARVAIRILRGEAPASIPIRSIEATPPVFDGRELARWDISQATLPVGSIVRFRQPGLWELYRWPVGGTVAFLLLQAGLIAGLLANRTKRRQRESEAQFVADLSLRFVNLPTSDLDREIRYAQQSICEFLGIDLAALWQWHAGPPGGFRLTHLYSAEKGPQPADRLQEADFPWVAGQVREGRVVAVSSVDRLPPEASRDRESARQAGIKSALSLPLSVGGQAPFGVIGFNTTRRERPWPPSIVSRMQLVAQIFANALARKRADDQIRAEEARLKAGARLAGLGHYEVDYGSGLCFVDRRFQEICGIPPECCEGRLALDFWLEHLHPEDRQRVLDERQELHRGTKNPISLEYRFLHPLEGEKWVVHLAALATHRPAGNGVRTFGVIRDITAQKRAERETEELRGNLAHMTRVNALGALSGSLAHELNQPLGIILSNAQAAQELLQQDPPDLPEVQCILADIVAADRRAGDVIQRLRALLERGEVTLVPLSLNEVLEEVLRLIQADLIGRGVSVHPCLAGNLPPIVGDRVQLQQLVLNLVLNAAEAMAGNLPATRRVHVRTSPEGAMVRVSIRDQGSGLPPDVERIFQPFYTTKSHGLGMGLAICRSIVSAHHGRIWAESHPERGAIFHVELPGAASGGVP
jgi:PAS domain S-box-containing protein